MNTASPSQVRALLDELGVRPSVRLGQNFLIDGNIRDISIARAHVSPGDRVLEIGPGLGILTEGLLEAGAYVMAVEKDRKLHAHLQQRFASAANFHLELGDALKLNFEQLFDPGGGTCLNKVVANLPYASGTRMLVDMFKSAHRPVRIVVTLQKEVGQRICASPSTFSYGLLSVWAQHAFTTRMEHNIKPGCFWPAPDVSSAIVSLERHEKFALEKGAASVFYDLTKRAFSQRRKQLSVILKRYPGWADRNMASLSAFLAEVGHSPKSRPEELSPEAWVRLSRFVSGCLGSEPIKGALE